MSVKLCFMTLDVYFRHPIKYKKMNMVVNFAPTNIPIVKVFKSF